MVDCNRSVHISSHEKVSTARGKAPCPCHHHHHSSSPRPLPRARWRHAKLKAPDLGISFTIPDAHARPTGCQNGIFCGRKLEEEEGLLCIVKVGSEYDGEKEEPRRGACTFSSRVGENSYLSGKISRIKYAQASKSRVRGCVIFGLIP